MRRPVLTLLLLSGLTFFLGLGRQAITDADEAFYAEAAREMVDTGDWLTPRFNYTDRWQKPVLYYWLTAATYSVAGVSEGAARFWSALSGLGLVLVTWAAARGLTSGGSGGPALQARENAAWLAGAIVATCYGYFAMARMALPDLPLTLCVTFGIWAALQRRWAIAGLAAGLGFLMKGPVALVVPGIVLLPIWWRERRSSPIRPRDVAMAAVVFLVVAVPWYAAMTLEHGQAYLHSFFVGDNLERFATDRFNEPRALWFYVPIVIGGMVPWAAYLVILPWRGVLDVVRRYRRMTDEEWRLAIWAFAPLLFFTISIGKQPRYILPVLPPLAILLARAITVRLKPDTTKTGLAVATWLTAALYAALAVLLWRARPLFISAYPVATTAALFVMAASSMVLMWVAVSKSWRLLPTAAVACAAGVLLSIQFGALAGERPEPVEEMTALVLSHRTSGEPVGEYQAFVRNMVFYTGFKQEELFNEGRTLDFVTSPDRVLLIIREADLARLESLARLPLKRLGQVDYLNTANLKLRTLTWPIPSQDLERVLLLSNR